MILVGTARMMLTPEYFATRVRPGFAINFTGLVEAYPRSILVPNTILGATDEYDFDIRYRDWLLMDNARFIQIFNITTEQINGNDVYLIRSEMADEYTFAYNIIESFLKFMQSRYGIRSMYINSREDWDIYLHDKLFENDILFEDPYIIEDDAKRYWSLVQIQE